MLKSSPFVHPPEGQLRHPSGAQGRAAVGPAQLALGGVRRTNVVRTEHPPQGEAFGLSMAPPGWRRQLPPNH